MDIPNPTLGSEQVLSRAAVGCWQVMFQHSGIQGTVIHNHPPRNVLFFGLVHAAGAERIHQTQADPKIQDENSVDNTPMFKLLLSSAYTKSRTFQLLTTPCH